MSIGNVTIISGPNGIGKTSALQGEKTKGKCRKDILQQINLFNQQNGPSYVLLQTEKRSCLAPTVFSFLQSNLVLAGMDIRQTSSVINKFLDTFDFANRQFQKLSTLSGGEDQIIHLLAALIVKAPGTILDDPLCMLDIDRQNRMIDVIKRFCTDEFSQRNILLTTSNGEELLSCFNANDMFHIHFNQYFCASKR